MYMFVDPNPERRKEDPQNSEEISGGKNEILKF